MRGGLGDAVVPAVGGVLIDQVREDFGIELVSITRVVGGADAAAGLWVRSPWTALPSCQALP